jgi:hypothetical protein
MHGEIPPPLDGRSFGLKGVREFAVRVFTSFRVTVVRERHTERSDGVEGIMTLLLFAMKSEIT